MLFEFQPIMSLRYVPFKCVEFFGKYLNVSLFKKISVFTI